MPSLNKVIIIGHLGQDPEKKFLANGDAVANFTIATSESWTDKGSGEKREKTEWHRCTCFRKLAEIAGEYLKKGALVYVEGKIQTRKWEKDGQTHYATEIVVNELKMLGGKKDKPAAKEESAPGGDFNDDSEIHF